MTPSLPLLPHIINNPRMFNSAIFDMAEKPYVPQKNLLQWVCCKHLAGCNRHSYFWPQRSWRLLGAKNTPQRPKSSWRSWLIEKVFNESFSAPSKTPWQMKSDLDCDLRLERYMSNLPGHCIRLYLCSYTAAAGSNIPICRYKIKAMTSGKKIHPSDLRGH